MKNTVLLVVIAALAALLSIIALAGAGAVRGANRINEEIATINSTFHQIERSLSGLRADLDTARVYIRDYMLDPVSESTELKRSQFARLKSSIDIRLYELSQLMGPSEAPVIDELRAGINGYFEFLNPILEAGPRGFPGGITGLRRELTAHREAAVLAAERIGEISEQNFAHGGAEIEEARRNLSMYLLRMTAAGIVLGVVVAVLSGYTIGVLQRQARYHQQKTDRAEAELRQLSGELVRAQEEERKSISRELHDEVGQTLTALGIEIGNIEGLRSTSGPQFDEHVADARRLTQKTLKIVRDLAMGLRPSMLDDAGLVPALRWQIREFSKQVGVPVDLQIDGSLDKLPENVSTCVYRVVQEALTNCARHANAHNVRIALHGKEERISLAIQDDGVGFDPSRDASGIGIIGIEERVRELGGNLTITSEHKRGALLLVEIPANAKTS